jgi:uncharacterized protein YecE (DUF72 family)
LGLRVIHIRRTKENKINLNGILIKVLTLEINGSFYRFPTANWTGIWKKYSPKNFRFSIKVHRAITHYNRLNGNKSINLWKQFRKTVVPIENRLHSGYFRCLQPLSLVVRT